MAEVTNRRRPARPLSTREFWAVDKVILAYLGLDHSYPGLVEQLARSALAACRALARRRRVLSTRSNGPIPPVVVFRNWYPLLVRSLLLQGNGALSFPPSAIAMPTGGSPIWISGSGATIPPSGSSASLPAAHRVPAGGLYTVCTRCALRRCCFCGKDASSVSSNIMLF